MKKKYTLRREKKYGGRYVLRCNNRKIDVGWYSAEIMRNNRHLVEPRDIAFKPTEEEWGWLI